MVKVKKKCKRNREKKNKMDETLMKKTHSKKGMR